MSIASEITRLQGVKSDILQAISDKGVVVPAGSALDDCPDLIASINLTYGSVVIGGRTYKTIELANQIWLAENLDYKFDVNGSQIPIGESGTPSTPAAWYYNNDEASYGIDGTYQCGLLYNWYAAKYLDDNKAALLPDGWRVPTLYDLNALLNNAGGDSAAGKVLKARDVIWAPSWNGSDFSKFGLLPGGVFEGNFSFRGAGTGAWLWSSTENSSLACYIIISTNEVAVWDNGGKGGGTSLRLVKDAT